MSKRRELITTVLLIILAGSLLSGSVWAKEIRTDEKIGIDGADIQALTGMTLQESNDGSSWTPMIGELATGFIMPLDPANTYEYLDVATLTGTVANGDYGFILDELDVPDDFYAEWAAKGVVAGATGWQGLMWQIISGQQPMFYLRVAGSEYDLIDGLSYLLYGSGTSDRLKVNGDYPLGHYTFEGTVDGQYMIVDITFTQIATVSIEGTSFTIDGCGYIDLYIHLGNVHNLYALDVTVQFDQTKVEVMDLDPVAPGVNLEPVGGLFSAAYWVMNDANNASGVIRYAATQYRPTLPAEGSGNIAKIRLRAKDFGTSPITVTAATLSDRDGYLVGVPLVLDTADVITTQFTAAGGLDLGIIRLNPTTVQLQWPSQSTQLVTTYTLHRSTLPYFTPGTGTVYQTLTNDGVIATYNDAVLGNVVNNYFYTLQLTCGSGLKSPYAWQVGKFEYTLYETTDLTDYALVGLVLENVSFIDTSTLAAHIEANTVPPVDVLSIASWDASSQSFQTPIFSPLPVYLKMPYRVEIDLANTSSGSAIWAQVGRLPAITYDTYTLTKTATTSYNWILVPLDMTGITDSDLLKTSIQTNTTPSATVNDVSEWNGVGQVFTSNPFGSIGTRFGYPYRIEINYVTGNNAMWP